MNIAGWAPTDTVISFAGLVWMSNILATLQQHGVYRLLIVAGVIWSLIGALREQGRLLNVGLYLVIAFALAEFFGGWGVTIAKQPSFAQTQGAQITPGSDSSPYTDVVAPRGFLTVTGALQDTVNALLPLINADFVKNPFALFAATNSLMTASLEHDPALAARVTDFFNQCYSPAVTQWLDQNPNSTKADFQDIDTPLSDKLTPLYANITYVPTSTGSGAPPPGTTCGAVWTPLKTDLYSYATQYGGTWFMKKLGSVLGWTGVGEDTWLRTMLRTFRSSHQPASGFNSLQSDGPAEALGSTLLAPYARLSNWAKVAQLVAVFQYAASPTLGYATAILYFAFPFVLAAALLPGGAGRLVTYFALLGSVKAWPLVWAMIDRLYTSVLPTLWPLVDYSLPGTPINIIKPPNALNIVTGMMYLIGPLMFSAALGMAGRQMGQGLNAFTAMRVPLFLLKK